MHFFRMISLIFLLIGLVGCASVEVDEDTKLKADSHLKIGIGYLSERRPQQAFIEFQKGLELDPSSKEILNAIGIVYLLHFNDLPKAAEYFNRAISIDPNYSEAHNNLGITLEKQGNVEGAIDHYKKAAANTLYKTPELAFINLGNAYYHTKRFPQALEAYTEASRRAPMLTLPYLKMALSYNAMRRYGEAASMMSQAIKIDTEFKGDRENARRSWEGMLTTAQGQDLQDVQDLLEILKY